MPFYKGVYFNIQFLQIISKLFFQSVFPIMSQPKKPTKVLVDKMIGLKLEPTKTCLKQNDSILYSLGVGLSQDPLREQDYKYTNQFHTDFCTFPTVGVVVPKANLITPLMENPNMPEFSPFQILHAEHRLNLIKPAIQVGVQYLHEKELIDFMDKGKNAFVLFRCNSYVVNQNGDKELAFQNFTLMFIKGLGGFNYAGKGLIQPPLQIPKRSPDLNLVGKTYPNQAFVYRLSFDYNPLHIDPNISSIQNFERPILHGLATYGTVAKVIIQEVLDNDPEKFQTMQSRFVGHVFPGETLDIKLWKDSDRLIFEAEVRERKTKVLIGYFKAKPQAKL